jgi:AraC-like DNA-binding protein
MDPIQLSTFRAPRGQDAGGRFIAPDLQEIEVITAGRGFFELDGRLLTALRGAMLWHLPGERTIYRNDFRDPYECLVVKFPWPVSGTAARPAPRFSRWSDPNECIAFTEELMSYYHDVEPDLELLAAYAYGTLRWHAHRGSAGKEERAASSPVGRAKIHIDTHYAKNLTLADLADSAAVSVPHLHALFRSELGITPHQALLDRRLSEARRLLAGTRLSVKEIAFRTGFAEDSALCKCFKTRCGCTPGEYRERHIQKDGE